MQALQDLYEAAEAYWVEQPPLVIKGVEELVHDLATAMTDLMREMKTEPGSLSSTGSRPLAMDLVDGISHYGIRVKLSNATITFKRRETTVPDRKAHLALALSSLHYIECDGTQVTVTGHKSRPWRFQRVGVHGYLTYRYNLGRPTKLLPVDVRSDSGRDPRPSGIDTRTLPDSFISDISLAISHVLDATDGLRLLHSGIMSTLSPDQVESIV